MRASAYAVSWLTALAVLMLAAPPAPAQSDEDWHVVERHVTNGPAEHQPPSATQKDAAKAGGALIACGEAARPASEPYKSIVAQLNDLNGTSFPVYESVLQMSPHASRGDCIFYNPAWLDALMKRWMRIDDPSAETPMLYAIFAHEEGHLVHGDLDPANEHSPLKPKELAADQFAGYTVERLGIRRLDPDELTFYYKVVGDDFVGVSGSHGSGDERTTAFVDGWHRAEVGLPETSGRPAGGLDQP